MGHHNLRYDGDAYALAGVWSPPTSKANFCEEDYAVTRYIAEFINSLTNLAYVYFALRYMYGSGSRGIFAPKWDFMSLALLGVGVASFFFHASMRQNLQLADDLSMFVLSWSFAQTTFTVRQSPAKARWINAILAIVFISFSAFYVWTEKIIYHTIGFVISLGCLTLRVRYLFHWLTPPFEESKRQDWMARTWKAIFISLFGYFLWNIDLELCLKLRALREQMGLPWAWFLELHGWWHIFTAIGASTFIDVMREVREELKLEKSK